MKYERLRIAYAPGTIVLAYPVGGAPQSALDTPGGARVLAREVGELVDGEISIVLIPIRQGPGLGDYELVPHYEFEFVCGVDVRDHWGLPEQGARDETGIRLFDPQDPPREPVELESRSWLSARLAVVACSGEDRINGQVHYRVTYPQDAERQTPKIPWGEA